jgi:hypothetical protein
MQCQVELHSNFGIQTCKRATREGDLNDTNATTRAAEATKRIAPFGANPLFASIIIDTSVQSGLPGLPQHSCETDMDMRRRCKGWGKLLVDRKNGLIMPLGRQEREGQHRARRDHVILSSDTKMSSLY